MRVWGTPTYNSAGRAIGKYDMLRRSSPVVFFSRTVFQPGSQRSRATTSKGHVPALKQIQHRSRKRLRGLLRRVMPYTWQLTTLISPAEKPAVIT